MTLQACVKCGAVCEGRHCAKHHPERNRPNAHRRGYTPRWARFARDVLRERPVCECGCGKPSEQVHHLDGRGPSGPLGFDRSNVQALTAACHSRITAEMQPGGWAA